MKRVIAFILFLSTIFTIIAQAPQGFNYQAILRNPDGTVKANEIISLQFSIVDEQGIPAYMEIHNTETNEFGLVNLVIGEGITTDNLATVDWASGPYFIGITVNGENLGSSPLLSVPYALYAASGNEGPQGIPGPQGIQGEKGLQGEKGDTGPQGLPSETLWQEINDDISYLDGRVGIGTNTPTEKLEVKGNLKVSGNIIYDGDNKPVSQEQFDSLKNLLTALQDYLFEDFFNFYESDSGSFMDHRDSTYYSWCRIGDQIWMAENLKYLPQVDSLETWGGMCYFVYGLEDVGPEAAFYDYIEAEELQVKNAKSTLNYSTYGVLYNWEATLNNDLPSNIFAKTSMVQGVCPSGWHLPSRYEWDKLFDYLGGIEVAGGKMKETGTSHWASPNVGATNESGFNALPGGSRYSSGFDAFMGINGSANWWMSDEVVSTGEPSTLGFIASLYNEEERAILRYYIRGGGFSVRCVKDAP